MKIKQGDIVQILAGKDRGKQGRIIEKPVPLDVSNVMLVCPVCKQPTRLGTKVKDVHGETTRVRVCKRDGCGQENDN